MHNLIVIDQGHIPGLPGEIEDKVEADKVVGNQILASHGPREPVSPASSATDHDAFAVAKVAQEQGHALKISDAQLHARIDRRLHFGVIKG